MAIGPGLQLQFPGYGRGYQGLGSLPEVLSKIPVQQQEKKALNVEAKLEVEGLLSGIETFTDIQENVKLARQEKYLEAIAEVENKYRKGDKMKRPGKMANELASIYRNISNDINKGELGAINTEAKQIKAQIAEEAKRIGKEQHGIETNFLERYTNMRRSEMNEEHKKTFDPKNMSYHQSIPHVGVVPQKVSLGAIPAYKDEISMKKDLGDIKQSLILNSKEVTEINPKTGKEETFRVFDPRVVDKMPAGSYKTHITRLLGKKTNAAQLDEAAKLLLRNNPQYEGFLNSRARVESFETKQRIANIYNQGTDDSFPEINAHEVDLTDPLMLNIGRNILGEYGATVLEHNREKVYTGLEERGYDYDESQAEETALVNSFAETRANQLLGYARTDVYETPEKETVDSYDKKAEMADQAKIKYDLEHSVPGISISTAGYEYISPVGINTSEVKQNINANKIHLNSLRKTAVTQFGSAENYNDLQRTENPFDVILAQEGDFIVDNKGNKVSRELIKQQKYQYDNVLENRNLAAAKFGEALENSKGTVTDEAILNKYGVNDVWGNYNFLEEHGKVVDDPSSRGHFGRVLWQLGNHEDIEDALKTQFGLDDNTATKDARALVTAVKNKKARMDTWLEDHGRVVMDDEASNQFPVSDVAKTTEERESIYDYFTSPNNWQSQPFKVVATTDKDTHEYMDITSLNELIEKLGVPLDEVSAEKNNIFMTKGGLEFLVNANVGGKPFTLMFSSDPTEASVFNEGTQLARQSPSFRANHIYNRFRREGLPSYAPVSLEKYGINFNYEEANITIGGVSYPESVGKSKLAGIYALEGAINPTTKKAFTTADIMGAVNDPQFINYINDLFQQ